MILKSFTSGTLSPEKVTLWESPFAATWVKVIISKKAVSFMVRRS
jgi:hypothetical protein